MRNKLIHISDLPSARLVCERGFCAARASSAFALAIVFSQSVMASPPLDPVPTPFYSFDAASPSVFGPSSIARSDEVLRIFQPDLTPIPVFPAQNLGLGQPNDDMDAMSFSKGEVMPTDEFIFMFAVDRSTSGDVPPDPLLLLNEVSYNVADQANRGQAAGDAFVTLTNYTVNGPVSRGLRGSPKSNVQAKNQYDEGGHDFGGKPETSSSAQNTGLEDGVNGLAYEMPESARGARGVPVPRPLFYSVTAGSPSLSTLPGNSGADIFRHSDPDAGGIPPQRFVSAGAMGLQISDDVDALIALDHDDNGVFNQGDLLFLSLAPGSPSLNGATGIPNISSNGAADILAVRFINPVTVIIEVFAPAAELGLLGDSDNVDALEFVFCSDPQACGLGVGIRLVRGDWNNDAVVNITDFPAFVPCLSGPEDVDLSTGFDPLCLDVFDYDFDGNVDLQDFQQFQFVFTP